jgi:hypothetical protein
MRTPPIGLLIRACKQREDVIQDKRWRPELERQEMASRI